MVKAQEGKRKDLVKFIAHQTCISPVQIYKLVASLELKKKILVNENMPEEPQPSILVESLTAPDPVAMATKAIEEEWTAKKVREEVAKQSEWVAKGGEGCRGIGEFSHKPQDASESWGYMFPLRDTFSHSRSS